MELPPKFWFRLRRLKASLHSVFGGQEQPYEAAHRMCPNCRALIDRGASECPLCGASLKAPRSRAGTAPDRVLGVIPVPSTATSAIVAVTLAMYGITWYMTQAAAAAQLSPGPSMGGVSPSILVRFGAKVGSAILGGHQWWRLVTAIFLHAGLLHIAMNLWCVFDLAPTVESMFSASKFVFMYLVTGVAGFALSSWWRPYGLSVGASGAILGLIGILIAASFHHGSIGREYRAQLWRWVIYIAIFGLLPFFAVDNAAHIGGFVSGLILGYFIPEGEPSTRSEENLWSTLAVVSVLVIAGSFAMMALQLNAAGR
jgi:rhomboid protease GluP